MNDQWHNLRPDGLATYRVWQHRLQFWLEWDRGTMNVRDLTIKFTAYAHYLASREWVREQTTLPALICVAPEIAQEQRIRRVASAVLAQTSGLMLATTTALLLAHHGPLAAIWQVSASQQHSSEGYARRLIFTVNTEMVDPRSL